MLKRLLALRNDVGLLSEEYDTGARRLVGNFPQAFSHLSLVQTLMGLHGDKPMREQVDDHKIRPGNGGRGGFEPPTPETSAPSVSPGSVARHGEAP